MGSTEVPIRGRIQCLQSCSLELPMLLQRLATLAVAMEAMVDMVMEGMVATVMERDLLKLMLSQDTSEEAMVMDMVVMVDMAVDTMERGRLMLSQDTLAVDMEAMVDMVMEDMEATVMERDLLKLMPSQDTTEEDMEVMVDMAVDTVMERGRLMPSQDTTEEDMAVMVDMD